MDIKKYMKIEGEKPLDNIVDDGGLCGIFRCIGFVGDSLSSGEFELIREDGSKEYRDCFPYSWGQYIARAAGLKARNFSRGGMTAKEYCDSFADKKGFWSEDIRCQAYVIALAVNDVFGLHQEIGTTADINADNCELNAQTFTGYYAKIVQRLKKIQPDAKFFFVTPPESSGEGTPGQKLVHEASAAIRAMADYFDNAYLIDLEKYAPVYDDEFKRNFYLEGHLNPAGYLLTGKMISSYIDYIIRNTPEEFRLVGAIPYDD